MQAVFNSIDEICNLEFVWYSKTPEGHDNFYLNEQSSLQILRELPITTLIHVTKIFSQRHRIAKKVDAIRAAKNVGELLEIIVPLVEDGNFPCDDFTLLLGNQIKLKSHNDGEVLLSSENKSFLHGLILKVFTRQQYNPMLISKVIEQPNLYHRLERPDEIIASYRTFDEVIDAI